MRIMLFLALCWALPAQAQVHGVAVQVSQGQDIPTPAQIRALTNPGDFVQDLVDRVRFVSPDYSLP